MTEPQQPYPAAPAHAAPSGYAAQPPTAGLSPWGPLADWGTRVVAMLIDSAVQLIGMVPYFIGVALLIAGAPDATSSYDARYSDYEPVSSQANSGLMAVGGLLIAVGILAMLGIQIWNRAFKQGRTGQSIGKKVMGISLVDERTGQPIGAGMAFVRDLAHVLDGFFYIGYLWPLWDEKRQTFADKILSTVVVKVPTR